jgi:hypothetical protein
LLLMLIFFVKILFFVVIFFDYLVFLLLFSYNFEGLTSPIKVYC